ADLRIAGAATSRHEAEGFRHALPCRRPHFASQYDMFAVTRSVRTPGRIDFLTSCTLDVWQGQAAAPRLERRRRPAVSRRAQGRPAAASSTDCEDIVPAVPD